MHRSSKHLRLININRACRKWQALIAIIQRYPTYLWRIIFIPIIDQQHHSDYLARLS